MLATVSVIEQYIMNDNERKMVKIKVKTPFWSHCVLGCAYKSKELNLLGMFNNVRGVVKILLRGFKFSKIFGQKPICLKENTLFLKIDIALSLEK